MNLAIIYVVLSYPICFLFIQLSCDTLKYRPKNDEFWMLFVLWLCSPIMCLPMFATWIIAIIHMKKK
jgi:hypothetical protein